MAKRPSNFDWAFVFLWRAGCQCRRFKRAGSPLTRALVVIASLVATIALAYASPVDPTWTAGIYDAADDEVVILLTETSDAEDSSHAAVESLTAVAKVAEHVCQVIQTAILLTIRPRSAPTSAEIEPAFVRTGGEC